VTALSRTFSRYHYEVFLFGGVLLIVLAIMTIFGKTIPLPFKVKANLEKSDVLSIFIFNWRLLPMSNSACVV